MLLHIHLKIKIFFNAIFVIYNSNYHRTFPPSIIEIYTFFDNLYVVVNIYILKEDYTIITKRSKKNKKKKLPKVWM